jgi:hypothetical protein
MIGFNLNLQNTGFVIQTFQLNLWQQTAMEKKQKIVVIGAGPVGSLAALYAANRGEHVEIYELRSGESFSPSTPTRYSPTASGQAADGTS